MKIDIINIPTGKVFIYKGIKYVFKPAGKGLKKLYYADGDLVPREHIFREFKYKSNVEVEVDDE